MKYDVKVWETEDDRNTGNSYIDESFLTADEAKEYAGKTFEAYEHACIEVQDEKGETILHLSDDECAYCDECGKEMSLYEHQKNQGLCNCCIEMIN